MNIRVFDSDESLAAKAAATIFELIIRKPNALIALATGHTPTATYEHLVKLIRKSKVSVSDLSFVALDEWVGLSPDTEGSCAAYLNQHLFEPLQIAPDLIRLFDALSPDLLSECLKTDNFIHAKGGIDLIVLGLGLNGHLGFNEPGTKPSYSHIVELDEMTRTVGQKYFRTNVKIEKGITLGLKSILESRRVLLLANGAHKSEIVGAVITSGTVPEIPATILHQHPACDFMLDREAAALVETRR